MTDPQKILSKLYYERFDEKITAFEPMAQSGSYRQYYRIKNGKTSVLGVYNTDLQENKAYLSFTEAFVKAGIDVPEIYATSKSEETYLVEDLGGNSLWDIAQTERERHSGLLTGKAKNLYRKTLKELTNIQRNTLENIDLSYCYPRDTFDKQSILWDLNYYKYFFLRLMRVAVDEQRLEDDIQNLATELDKIDQEYFLYRDFQSRNVMIKDEKPYFIDFQGGRKGSFYYDLASILYDANVELHDTDIEELKDYYYEQIKVIEGIEKEEFEHNFALFSVVRLCQALGAFGLRGVVEKKPHFKECIPFALKALKKIMQNKKIKEAYPTLYNAAIDAVKSTYINEIIKQ